MGQYSTLFNAVGGSLLHADQQTVLVEQDVTTSEIGFILGKESINLTPIYLLLLNE